MIKDLRQKIKEAVQQFSTGNLSENALNLFQTLGYITERRAPLEKPTYAAFRDSFIDSQSMFNEDKALVKEWKYVDLLFQLSKEEVTRQLSLFDTKQVDRTIIETYLFFAIEMAEEHYSRTELSHITREVNRLFPMPVMILFKHGFSLTLSVINRRLHKRDESKDVLQKVTLIKDIRISPAGGGDVEIPLKKGGKGVVLGKEIVSGGDGAVTHRAHIEILFDLSFDELKNKHKFTNFVELHDAWQKALDTSELNKRFFRELANWYFWATQKVVFPDDAGKDKDVRNATSVIRLITRLMFVWFLKEKGLVPDALFDEKQLKKLLKYTDNKKSSYYKAILQNLFFATLNTEMGKRGFRTKNDGGRDGHYFIHNVFRYENEFVKPKETLEQYFSPIPFLNGGLFECLDKELDDNGKRKRIRIDSFSDREDNVLEVPDELFFNEKGVDVDLSRIYSAPKKSKEKVYGIIDILNSYKFTVAENTPIEEEIALDPELLGKVFENLLANYNPETQTTARKQTGSFNTPREMVNDMVDESLLAYLKQKLEEAGYKDTEPRLRELLSYSENPNPFNAKETAVLIKAIDNCKILDPACGSGAFPMGILHKLVHILHKLDPNNAHWKQRQLDKVDKLIKEAEGISDTRVREKVIEDLHDTRRDIEEAFDNNELDYGRKLYLIENCIYGVDIQPIAVQIAKLRFFISLIVDQKVNPNRDNLGIRPLPNLETKFVAANTLIGLEKEQANLFTNPNIEKKKAELKKVRHDYFEARTPKRKENCRIKDKQLRDELAELLIQNHDFQPATAKKIAAWDPYDQNASSPFFDPEWMFGLKEGFDVVIGNPPYGILNKKQNKAESIIVSDEELAFFKSSNYYKPASGGMINIFRLFILRSIYLLAKDGIFSEIFPLAFIGDVSISRLRKYILDHSEILFIEAFPERDNPNKRVFEAVKMSVCILNLKKSKSNISNKPFFIRINTDRFIDENAERNYLTKGIIETIDKENSTFPVASLKETSLLLRIFSNSIRFSEIGKCNTGEVDMTFCKESFSDNPKDATLLKGAIIDRYQLRTKMSQGEIVFINEKKLFTLKKNLSSDFKKSERIVLQGITGVNEITRLKMMIIKDAYCANSLNYLTLNKRVNKKYLLGIFNSKLLNFIFKKFSTNSNVNGYEIDNLPVILNNNAEFTFQTIIDYILFAKSKSNKNIMQLVNFFECLIDAMVYELYLPEEVMAASTNVLCHLQDLPDIQPLVEKGETEKALKTIEKVYKELTDQKHPVSAAMFKMDTIEEIRIIEGKQ